MDKPRSRTDRPSEGPRPQVNPLDVTAIEKWSGLPPQRGLGLLLIALVERSKTLALPIRDDYAASRWVEWDALRDAALQGLNRAAPLFDGEQTAPLDAPSTRIRAALLALPTAYGPYDMLGDPHRGDRRLPENWSELIADVERWGSRIFALRQRALGRQSEQGERRGMPKAEANIKARELLRSDRCLADCTCKEWAKRIGCSEGTVVKLPTWKAIQEKKSKASKGRMPSVVSLTDSLQANTDRRGKVGRAMSTTPDESVLAQLIREQRVDREPSPLEADSPDAEPARVRARKRL